MQRELKAVGLFCLIAFALSWGMVGVMFATGGLAGQVGRIVAALLFPIGAGIAAVATVFWWKGRLDLSALGLNVQLSPWILASWMAPALIAVLTLAACALIPGVSFSFDPAAHPLPPDADEAMKAQFEQAKAAPIALRIVAFFVGSLFQGTMLNLLFRFFEELGWRGVVVRLLGRFGFWRMSILTGFLVGIWSMPLVLLGSFYSNHTQAGLFMIVPFMVLVSPLVTFFRLRSGSVLGAALFSAALAGMTRFLTIPYVSGSDLLYGIPGAAGFIALVVANALIVVPRWKQAEDDLRALIET